MPTDSVQYLRRASIEGALCTIRCRIAEGVIPNTKGQWLGVEWDDPRRGKHDGFYHGQRLFQCRSVEPTVASFVKATRKLDAERTVLEAIHFKYGGGDQSDGSKDDIVVISGKVAEEVGFDKIAKEQSTFESLKIVVLEKLNIYGLTPRGSSKEDISSAQTQLAETCPNIVELDLGYNVFEEWNDIWDICIALPKLRTLRLNGLRLRPMTINRTATSSKATFPELREVHLNECLVDSFDVFDILGSTTSLRFPRLEQLWLSQNELKTFPIRTGTNVDANVNRYESIRDLILEKNLFKDLVSLDNIVKTFPNLKHLSLQNNQIESVYEHTGEQSRKTDMSYQVLESLSISSNQITSFEFVDTLASVLPGLSALRISKNPLYETAQSTLTAANPSETNYYLTLARIPSLKMLNYTQITSREREEGEIYFLSVAERDIKATLVKSGVAGATQKRFLLDFVRRKYPRYEHLCKKHDRDSIVAKTCEPSTEATTTFILEEESKPKFPPGSIAANLIKTTFHLSNKSSQQSAISNNIDEFTWRIPLSTPTSQIFALVARAFNLAPLQFRLIYESHEFDPVRADFTTRSQLYTPSPSTHSLSTANQTSKTTNRYQGWGDWDADAMVEESISKGISDDSSTLAEAKNEKMEGKETTERWSEEGYLLKDGGRWQRREIEILMGLRDWGDWLDGGVDCVSVRVEV